MREREERECGGMMDSYDVRKAITVLILVCTEYVGLYRESGEPPARGSQLPGHGRCTFAKSYLISEAALLDSTITMIEYFYSMRAFGLSS
jgi:hypothetical protein